MFQLASPVLEEAPHIKEGKASPENGSRNNRGGCYMRRNQLNGGGIVDHGSGNIESRGGGRSYQRPNMLPLFEGDTAETSSHILQCRSKTPDPK